MTHFYQSQDGRKSRVSSRGKAERKAKERRRTRAHIFADVLEDVGFERHVHVDGAVNVTESFRLNVENSVYQLGVPWMGRGRSERRKGGREGGERSARAPSIFLPPSHPSTEAPRFFQAWIEFRVPSHPLQTRNGLSRYPGDSPLACSHFDFARCLTGRESSESREKYMLAY